MAVHHTKFDERKIEMPGRSFMAAIAVCLLACGTPAMAGRSIIDQDPNGDPIFASVSGYCDFNGEDCYDSSGIVLPYQVSFGGSAFTNRVIVHGNGLLTFAAPIDFSDQAIQDAISSGVNPPLAVYDRALISAGQSNTLAFDGTGFMQSATLFADSATGTINAGWFVCGAPTAPGVCPHNNPYSLTLTPVSGGFSGHFDLSAGAPDTTDRGYVIGGVFTATGNDFFLPATFEGLSNAVPEPATWMTMILGLGIIGGALRRAQATRGRTSLLDLAPQMRF